MVGKDRGDVDEGIAVLAMDVVFVFEVNDGGDESDRVVEVGEKILGAGLVFVVEAGGWVIVT